MSCDEYGWHAPERAVGRPESPRADSVLIEAGRTGALDLSTASRLRLRSFDFTGARP